MFWKKAGRRNQTEKEQPCGKRKNRKAVTPERNLKEAKKLLSDGKKTKVYGRKSRSASRSKFGAQQKSENKKRDAPKNCDR